MKMILFSVRLTIGLALLSVVFGLFGLTASAQTGVANPLFSGESVIKIKLVAPISTITRKASKNTDPHEATLIVEGASLETHSISLAARGNSRRRPEVCRFPPLRVKFSEKPALNSLFSKQKSLKLVTHCQRGKRKQKYALLEYSAYKLFNVVTPESLRVRMAEIEYVEAKSGKIVTTRYGFFIEDTDDAAARNGLKEIDRPRVGKDQVSHDEAARYALFQYMIGNIDWSMQKGPDGKDCCHNTKLMGASKSSSSQFKLIPYDFDFSGLVDAPYAIPPENIKISSVKVRRYRGLCIHNQALRRQVPGFKQNRQRFEAAISGVPGLSSKEKTKAIGYLSSFFNTLNDPTEFEERVVESCRT